LLTGYSLAFILGSTSIGIVVLAIALSPLLRRPEAVHPPAPACFAELKRPEPCNRCGASDLVVVPRLALIVEAPTSAGARPLDVPPPTRSIELELWACRACGRVAWFATSPQVLGPFRGPSNPP